MARLSKEERRARRKARWKKVGSFFKRVAKTLFVWGKPIIKSEINKTLAPKLKETLKAKINAGAIDKKVDELIEVGVDKAVEEFNKKL